MFHWWKCKFWTRSFQKLENFHPLSKYTLCHWRVRLLSSTLNRLWLFHILVIMKWKSSISRIILSEDILIKLSRSTWRLLAVFDHLVLKAKWDVKYYPEEKWQTDWRPGILLGMKSLKVSGFVDGDISVDCHADDDVHAAGHEGVYKRQHEMSLEEGRGVLTWSPNDKLCKLIKIPSPHLHPGRRTCRREPVKLISERRGLRLPDL